MVCISQMMLNLRLTVKCYKAIQQHEFPSTISIIVSLQKSVSVATTTASGVMAALLGTRLPFRWNWFQKHTNRDCLVDGRAVCKHRTSILSKV